MRVIILGLGAIGGTVAAALALAGQDVLGIARGAQLDAIREGGLTLRTPEGTRTARFDCVGSPSDVAFRPEDVVLLATKTQHSLQAMEDLRAAGMEDQPLFCLQNGVENERLALRRFPNVHGVTVMMPAQFLVPGEVACFSTPCHGLFDIGRYPEGSDADDERLAEALNAANIAAFVAPDVMASKYGKLLLNLRNAVQATIGMQENTRAIDARLQEEARAVLEGAGIAWKDVSGADPRRDRYLKIVDIAEVKWAGSSSVQSLLRGTESIETDYLNGEIALLARLHGLQAPANAWFTRRAARMVADRAEPGSVPLAEAEAALGL